MHLNVAHGNIGGRIEKKKKKNTFLLLKISVQIWNSEVRFQMQGNGKPHL